MKKFNKDKYLKKIKSKKFFKKNSRYFYIGISCFLCCILGLYFTYSKFYVNQEEEVLRTVVGDFSTGDIVLNTFIGDKKSDKIPSKNDGYSISKVVCDNDVWVTWNEEQWSLLVTKVTRRTKCSLYFTIIKEYDYSGKEDIFTVLESGTYKLETWGAQGGSYNSTYHGGYGGYSVGYVKLNEGDKL